MGGLSPRQPPAVTWYVVDASVSAVPVLSRPGVMLTAVTVPSIGATSFACRIWRCRSRTPFWAWRRAFTALYQPIRAWRTGSVPVAASSVAFAAFSWSCAPLRLDLAITSWSLRSSVDAVARTAPFFTGSPTFMVTVFTVHVPVPAGVVDPSLTRSGGAPNPSAYASVEATVPVAATSAVTSPTAAAEVRYSLAPADAPRGNAPPSDTNTAAPPTTTSRRITNRRSFTRGPR